MERALYSRLDWFHADSSIMVIRYWRANCMALEQMGFYRTQWCKNITGKKATCSLNASRNTASWVHIQAQRAAASCGYIAKYPARHTHTSRSRPAATVMMSPVLLLMVNMLEEGLWGFWERILYRNIPLAIFGSSLSTAVTVITKDPAGKHTASQSTNACVHACVHVCVHMFLPGLDPSGTEPLKMACMNSGLLSFWSITLMTMSMGFSTWFPFRSTAWARNCTQTHTNTFKEVAIKYK